jgi:drug/metabolite transporter (DMT)-like permease
MRARTVDLLILAIGVVAVSTAAVLIRQAEAPSLVIAAYRLSLASLPLLLIGATRRERSGTGSLTSKGLTAMAGVFLALHFAFWIASVKQTSIVTSVVLVTAQPLFVAVASGPLLREPASKGAWGGIVLAAAGASVMVIEDVGEGSDTLAGDLYAMLGAIFASAYFLTVASYGRPVRAGFRM